MAENVIAIVSEGELLLKCGRCGADIPIPSQDVLPANYCHQCGVRLDQSRKKRPPRVEWND